MVASSSRRAAAAPPRSATASSTDRTVNPANAAPKPANPSELTRDDS
jgi:hypothetical protein